jgi:hypothetical protein
MRYYYETISSYSITPKKVLTKPPGMKIIEAIQQPALHVGPTGGAAV